MNVMGIDAVTSITTSATDDPIVIKPIMRLPELEDWITMELKKTTNREVDRKRRRMRFLLWVAYTGRNPHKAPPLKYRSDAISQFQHIALGTSFAVKVLQKDLGGTANVYSKYIDPFLTYHKPNAGYSYRYTKCYHLHKSVESKLTELWRDSRGGIAINDEDGSHLTLDKLPSNGVMRSSYSIAKVPAFIPFDLAHVDRCIERQEERVVNLGNKGGWNFFVYRREVYQLRRMYEIRLWVRTLGGIINVYEDAKNGRLTGKGQGHIQYTSQRVRQLLLADRGWWDYDFSGCHYYITQSLCRAYNIRTPTLDHYLKDKKEVETYLAENEFEIPANGKKIKKLMLALLYDQSLSSSPYTAVGRMFNKSTIDIIRNNQFISNIRKELKYVRKEILRRHYHDGNIINAVGKERSIVFYDEKEKHVKNVPERKLFSHVLMGYEARALDIVLSEATDTATLLFDGWISMSEQNISLLEQHLHTQSEILLGFPLTLTIKAKPLT